jgi:enamine deaminase RidA (YjgF/YER057c/UK114 family)
MPSLAAEEEIERAFQRMKTIIKAAGGRQNGIGEATVYLKDFKHREIVNKSWLKILSEENNRPPRQVIARDLPGKRLCNWTSLRPCTSKERNCASHDS